MRCCAVLLVLVSLAFAPAPRPKAPRSLRIGGYAYALPAWWDAVEVVVPSGLKTESDVQDFVRRQYGKDVGGAATWRQALKTHATAAARLNYLPVYIAHCHQTGGEYARAAQVFGDLYELAAGQGKAREWYECYLACSAGAAYARAGDTSKARLWYARSARYAGHADGALAYYARESAKALAALER